MSLRVLLVDDGMADRLAVSRALARDPDMQWEVVPVSSAEDALAYLSGNAVDAMLLDYHLPGMNGVSMLQKLAELGLPRVPAVVVLTGSGNERVAVDAMKAGAQDYLVKEAFSPERLRRSLRAAVDTVLMTRELEERRLRAERAEAAARDALAVRDELFSLATHDLKGPLQIMTLNAQVLRRQIPAAAMTPALETRLGHIVRAAHRMGELIDHFLEVTRGQERPLKRESMDLLAMVRGKVRELEANASRHHLVLEAPDGRDFTGEWDAHALERVLENLMGNAVKYSAAGSTVTVQLAMEEGETQQFVLLSVTDQGIGIPVEDLPFVFERFHRGRNVSQDVSGSGVGLASARRMVELHGGTLAVRSVEGQGSTFTVRLPRGIALAAGPARSTSEHTAR
ncbi:hybrid sensor histidine kinase/response regulator [Corallococcus exiguus]|uniref:hybrid sensor histidine kinase/response regulator n=1 Tax=Corallococcus TaxID=83461 RepID=UPI000EA02646|nr:MULTISPECIES: hybrid sensor histidine kinase/response regulator [Corallococcus]NNC14510.1 hybrid sensor histidine kinase/response regulator [Corallococcus exiguus]NRD52850.1 hybrid sensor histidine kinase/response regulator [Corallococcus exiguus]NRD60446.1 hybrid sensor histidine kinase/response regulator [Corallococcus exiguus]RKH31105.1 hybrid sensor histidine kinase/response regulator [Corallococcus sp. CA041A]RKI19513.1 hybrid sensor histidine kinase/response regulator [Corallococcus s